ncbi:MAG: 3-carboxy-cis,cis-muconate cycloisomerase [Actinobacteria bacterium]|nr:3-carboxy-cis,cis-muconate cycloisomerase [Actinomycetota bacterium]
MTGFDPGFTTPSMSEIFSPGSTVAAMLEFEAALALSLAAVGVVSAESAERVAEACARPVPDSEAVLASTWESGTPLLAIRSFVSETLDPAELQAFHHGATTQDAVDTGRMLQTRDALTLLESGLLEVARSVHRHVGENRDRPHMARTFLQDAVPTTFAARLVSWLASTLDRLEEVRLTRSRLRFQLGGPSGDLASYGAAAGPLLLEMERRLELRATLLPWHTDRSQVWEIARVTEGVALTMRKIATDIALLAQTSVGEVIVRPGASSSMPGKRNPIDSVRAVAAATAATGLATMLTGAPANELDRGLGGWHVEWLALPMLLQTCAAAVEAMSRCLDTMEVNVDRMSRSAGGATGDSPMVDLVLARYRSVVE